MCAINGGTAARNLSNGKFFGFLVDWRNVKNQDLFGFLQPKKREETRKNSEQIMQLFMRIYEFPRK